MIPAGEWVKFHIEAHGKNLTLDVNGKRLWEFDRLEPATGHIGFQSEGRAVEFRVIRLRGNSETVK